MRETWRWFGPPDPITLAEVRQTGAQGIVSALHHVPSGVAWTEVEVADRKAEIAAAGLTWDVIESIPVSEAIKTRTGPWQAHIEAWINSLRAVAKADGPRMICYNFMPVLDWTRTDLRHPVACGGTAMRFDLTDFAAFDIHLLKRDGAEATTRMTLLRRRTDARIATMDAGCRKRLPRNITAGLPGSTESWTLDDVRARLADYHGMGPETLRDHLIAFLEEVVPVAEELGLRLCCHPDDPPFPLLGLPRVVSSLGDYRRVLDAVESPANGATFCTGSLGVRADFDPVAFVEKLGDPHPLRPFAQHQRGTGATTGLRVSFEESAHLAGDTDMVATIRALMAEETRRVEKPGVPMPKSRCDPTTGMICSMT
jgi:mannonate dehydratase